MGVTIQVFTDEPFAEWLSEVLFRIIDHATTVSKMTVDKPEIAYADFSTSKHGPQGFNPRVTRKSANLKNIGTTVKSMMANEYGALNIMPKDHTNQKWLVIGRITRVPADVYGPGHCGTEVALVSPDPSDGTDCTYDDRLLIDIATITNAYYGYIRYYERFGMEMLGELWNFTSYEINAGVKVPHFRLRDGIRGVFFDNVLNNRHLSDVDFPTASVELTKAGWKVEAIELSNNISAIRVGATGFPRQLVREETDVFERVFAKALP